MLGIAISVEDIKVNRLVKVWVNVEYRRLNINYSVFWKVLYFL